MNDVPAGYDERRFSLIENLCINAEDPFCRQLVFLVWKTASPKERVILLTFMRSLVQINKL